MRESCVAGVVAECSNADEPVECEPSAERVEQLIEALELPLAKLTEEQSRQLCGLVRTYSDVFALNDQELGCTDVVKHVIKTGDHHPPVRQQP